MQLQAEASGLQPLPNQQLERFQANLRGAAAPLKGRMPSRDNFQSQLLLQSQLGLSMPTLSGNIEIDLPSSPTQICAQTSNACCVNQVQVATQTPTPTSGAEGCTISSTATSVQQQPAQQQQQQAQDKKQLYPPPGKKKPRFPLLAPQGTCQQQQTQTQPQQQTQQQQQPNNFATAQNYQLDPAAVTGQYTTGVAANNGYVSTASQVPPAPFSCMDVDSETDSNHDTALTLACAGGHEELVELLLSRGADIEHRDKKGFTPLILAATAGHQKVVEILLNHSAEIEAQSERTKDTPLSLACSGGRYEVSSFFFFHVVSRLFD